MATPAVLGPDTGAADGFRRIVAARLGHLSAHEAALRAGEMEGIHQARVALRQLRATIVLFAPLLDPGPAERFEAELRRLGRVLGHARDWDVFCAETLPAAFPHASDGWHRLLDAAARWQRAAAHGRLAAEMGGLKELGAGLAAWAGGTALSGFPGPLRRHAPALLDRLARKVRKRGRHLLDESPEELHALRKALKKLRYGTEDLALLFPGRRARPYRAALRQLQEILGGLNDAAMAASLARRLRDEAPSPLHDAATALILWADARRDEAARRLVGPWAGFADARPFW